MSNSIDRRIVEMQFENRQFEQGARTSMGTLEKLKRSLDFSGAARGMSALTGAMQGVDMTPMANAVENVSLKFRALEVAGVTAMMNLANRAVDTGISLVKSLSIDQVNKGWEKYGDKTAQVQTIMNATGKSIDEVNGYLDKLMWFSDETSYSFNDMTAALGQLTSAGGDVDKLIPMIQGIANATAYAGKGAAEFSRSIYNLNQSYSSGHLQYMDWKSLELAGVASKQLKETFIETAVALGKVKEGEIDLADFGSTLKSGWADTEVMEQAFGKFNEMTELAYEMVQSGEVETASEAYDILASKYDGVSITAAKAAQEAKTLKDAIDATKDAVSSGWMKTFELIFGNYQEAKVLWTDLANYMWDVFASGSEARNSMLEEWKDLGGRDSLIQGLTNILLAVQSAIEAVKESFRDIFPAMTGERLAELTRGFEAFTEKLTGFFTVTAGFQDLQIDPATGQVENLGKAVSLLSEPRKSEGLINLQKTLKGIFAVLHIGAQAVSGLLQAGARLLGIVTPAAGGILGMTGALGDWLVALDKAVTESGIFTSGIGRMLDFLSPVADAVKALAKGMLEAVTGLLHVDLSGLIQAGDGAAKALSPLSAVAAGAGKVLEGLFGLLGKIMPALKTVGEGIGNAFSGLGESLGKIDLGSIVNLLNAGLFGALLQKFGGLTKAFTGIGEDIGGSLGGIKEVLNGVKETMEAYQTQLKAGTLLKIAGAIGIMAGAILLLSSIEPARMAAALGGMAILLTEISLAVSQMGGALKLGQTKNFTVMAAALVAFSAGILILSGAVKVLSTIDPGALVMGLAGLGAILTELSVFLKLQNGTKFGAFKATGILLLSAAILVLAKAVQVFSRMKPAEMVQGLVGVAAVLAEIAGFTKLAGSAKHIIATSASMLLLSTSLLIFAGAIEKMGRLSWGEIGRGLVSMAGALTAVILAMNLMPKGGFGKAIGLTAFAAGLLVLSAALQSFGAMPLDAIGRGLLAMGGSLVLLSAGLFAMKTALPGAAALLVAAAALTVLAPVMERFGQMELSEIGKSLLMLAGTLAIFGVAGSVLGPVVPVLLGLAGAVALFGIGCLAAGTGVAAFGAGLTALAAGGAAAASALTLMVVELINLIPLFAQKVGEGFVNLCWAIANSAEAICGAIVAVIHAVCQAALETLPEVAYTVVELLAEILVTIADHIPEIMQAGLDILIGLLEGLANNMDRVIDAATSVVITFLEGIGAKLPDVVNAGFDMMIAFLDGLSQVVEERTPELIASFVGLGGSLITGLIQGLFSGLGALGSAISKIGQTVASALSGIFGGGDNTATITPVMNAGGSSYGTSGFVVGNNTKQAGTVAGDIQSRKNSGSGNSKKSGGTTQNINFTQNNYSPKALSPIETYRQGQKLTQTIRGAVK